MLTLRCGLLPGESPADVARQNEPMRDYLQRQLGVKVELIVGSTCVAVGEALRRGELDLAYLGPVTYILQSRTAALEPFARPTHGGSVGPTFRAAIIVPWDSEAKTLLDLRGDELAFTELMSTAGSWVPRHMLLKSGLKPEGDYRRRHLGSHEAVIAAVAACQVAAGGVSLPLLKRSLYEGRCAPGSVRILAESPPIPEYLWTFRERLPERLRDDIRQAFFAMRQPAALAAYHAEAFIPSVDADVDRVRYWLEEILQTRLREPTSARDDDEFPKERRC